VVRASKTSRSLPIVTEGVGFNPPANVTKTFPTVESPPIFAVRDVSGGTFMADKKEIQPFRWHVAVNSPMERPVTVTVKQNFALPGLEMAPRRLTLQPGQYTVLVQ
jgi:hypothetical protein